MRKFISILIAAISFITTSLNVFPSLSQANAATYRTSYKIYGDLNNDSIVDIYDVISMRKEILKNEYNKDLDFNCDDIVDSNDLELLNNYVLGNVSFFSTYLNDDADEDKICDLFEVVQLKTDPDSKDTDGDSLSDYEEVIYTNTSPTNKHTRGLSVTDDNDDADKDKLTNKEELTAKTDPQITDTDADGLGDYDEIYTYGTNPLIPDSDEDGIDDGSEIKLGLDPNNPTTNGIPDGECIISQSIEEDNKILFSINTPESPYELSIDIMTNGDAEEELVVSESDYSAAIENDAMIGTSFDLNIADTCTPEEIVLKYNIKEDYIDNKLNKFSSLEEFQGIKRLNVFNFDEEQGMLLPIDTEFDVDNNQLYAKVNKTGTYCLMDMEIWLDELGVEMSNENNVPEPKYAPKIDSDNSSEWEPEYVNAPIDIVFILQTAGASPNMFRTEKMEILAFCEMVFKEYNNIRVHIIGFERNKAEIYSNGLPYFTNYEDVNNALDSIDYTELAEGVCCNLSKPFEKLLIDVDLRENSDRFIYFVTNDFTQKYDLYDQWDVIKNNVGIYSQIDPSNIYWKDNDSWQEMVNKIEGNGGLYTRIRYKETSSEMFENFKCNLSSSRPVYDIFLPTKWKKITLDGELISNGTTNSDADELTDWEEVDESKIKINYNGSIELPVLNLADAVTKLKRFNQNIEDIVFATLSQVHYLPVLSDPTDEDTDDDGYNDDIERNLGTEPLMFNVIFDKDEYDYLMDNDYFDSSGYRQYYYDHSIEAAAVVIGSSFFAGKPNRVDLCKLAIAEYLNYLYDGVKTAYKIDQLINLEESMYESIIDTIDSELTILEETKIWDANIEKDVKLLEELKGEMLRKKADMKSVYYKDAESIENFYKRMDETRELYNKTADQVESLEKQINIKKQKFPKLKRITDWADKIAFSLETALTFRKSLETYMNFADIIERMEMGIEVLEVLEKSPDPDVSKAAGILKQYAFNAENDLSFALHEANNAAGDVIVYYSINVALAKVPYVGVWLELTIVLGNILINYGDMSEQAELLITKAYISDAMAGQLQKNIKFNSANNVVYSSSGYAKYTAKYLINLIMGRCDAESQCVMFYEAFPWYLEWRNSQNIEHAKNNITVLNDYLNNYITKYASLLY